MSHRNSDGDAERIALQPKPFDVLCYLVERAGHIVTPDEFLTAVWPDTYVQPEVLKGHVLAVRTALRDRVTPARYIETVRGRGYRFIAEVRTMPLVKEDDRAAPELLVGRATARNELDLALQRTRSGQMQMVFLTGEAGIGKTALVQAFARSAAGDGATVVIAHCLPGSGETDAYYPILEILTGLSRSPVRARLATALKEFAPTWLVQLPFLMPTANVSKLSKDVAGATSHRMARELRDALDALAQRELLLLVLEDVHWADQATLDLIQALANRRSHAQLLIVATLRSPGPTDAGHAAIDLVHRCSVYRVARDIKLTPLELGDVEAFLDRYAHAEPPSVLTQHLYARSEGNPLFLRAMLDHLIQRKLVSWDETGWRLNEKFEPVSLHAPPDLVQLIEAEIRSLSSEAQKVLEAASLTDGPFSAAVYHVASGMDEQAFEAVCETLARQGHFIRRSDVAETPGGGFEQTYAFRHALFQDAAYDRQGSAQRAARHAAVANRLETTFSADLARVASSLARHATQARLWRQAIHFLSIASRTAMRRFAMNEASALLEQATELCRNLPDHERGAVELELLDELSRIYLGAFDKRARATYDRLYPLARELGRVDVEVRALVGLAYVTSAIDSDRCLEIMSQALDRSADIADPVQRGRLRCSAHGWRNWILGWSATDVAGFEAALDELRAHVNPLILAASEFDHGLILLPAGRYADAIEAVSRGLSTLVEHALEAGADVSFPLWTSRLGVPWAMMSLGQFGEAIARSVANCAACEANGHFLRSGTLHLYQAFTYIEMHDYPTALAVLDKTAAMISNNGLEFPPNEVKVELVVRGLACLGLGQLEDALKHLRAARAEMDARNTLTSWYWRLVGEWGMTDAHLVAGDLVAAEACAKGLLERACAIEERTWRGLAAEACARVALAQGRPSSAGEYLAQAWADIRGYDTPLVRWRLHAVEALLSEFVGARDSARQHRQSRAEQLEMLAASLPPDHPGRDTLRSAQPIAPHMTSVPTDRSV